MTAASSYLAGTAYGQLLPKANADGDGLLNTWEQIGIDVNNDGVIGLIEPKADPLHKNHYVEIDQMVNH